MTAAADNLDGKSMDFLKILKSFEEFVYEALTWLILLPRTLLRILWSPARMTDYASGQLSSQSESRFSEAISPPLLLMLCVLLSHAIDLGIRNSTHLADGSLAAVVLSSEQGLLLYRTISFGVWALAGAVYLLMRTGAAVNRETLRVPFYEQCYLVAPFALLLSCSMSLLRVNGLAAVLLLLSTLLWFWLVQAAWLRRRSGFALWRSLVAATVVLLAGSIINLTVGYFLTQTSSPTAAQGAATGQQAK